MNITSLTLSSFRRFSKYTFSFSPYTTIIIGPNTSGKTTILEAVYLLALGKSFRTFRDSECISFEKELSRINGIVKQKINQATEIPGKTEQKKLEIIITLGEVAKIKTPLKKFLVNGVGKRMVDFVGNLSVVLFWPQDLELVTDSPSLRRHYLNYVLSQTDREYRRTLASYDRGVRQRNRLLEAVREGKAHRHQLLFWDQLLIRQGEYISKKREEYINYINNYKFSNPPSGGQIFQLSQYQLVYDASVISRQRFDQYAAAEVAAGVTLVGPHRDNVIFQIKEILKQKTDWRDLSSFGSRGEQRLSVLWLKLAELAYIEKVTGEKPVLLLDDILSELDHPHRHAIFSIMGLQQTILTITDKHFIENDQIKDAKIIELN